MGDFNKRVRGSMNDGGLYKVLVKCLNEVNQGGIPITVWESKL